MAITSRTKLSPTAVARRLALAYRQYPQLESVVAEAKAIRQANTPVPTRDYNQTLTWIDLRNMISAITGPGSAIGEGPGYPVWQFVTDVILDLLPDDRVELYPDGEDEADVE